MIYKIGEAKVTYPVRGVVEEFPKYIKKENKQLTLQEVVDILNTQELIVNPNGKRNRYKVKYSGDINFITMDGINIDNICYILFLLNHNQKFIENTDEYKIKKLLEKYDKKYSDYAQCHRIFKRYETKYKNLCNMGYDEQDEECFSYATSMKHYQQRANEYLEECTKIKTELMNKFNKEKYNDEIKSIEQGYELI